MPIHSNKLRSHAFVISSIFVMLVSVVYLAGVNLLPTVKADSGWLEGWGYRQSHSITYSGSLTDYQVLLNVYAGSGTSSGNKVYLSNHCVSFPKDINFTDSNNNYYRCWMEDSNATWAKIWVKITSIPATIYVYYGNSGQTSFGSNGDATFVFFDDFSGSIDWTNKWYSTGQSFYTITSGQLKCSYPTSNGQYIRTKNTFGDSGYCVTLKCMMSSSSSYSFYATYGDDNSTNQGYSFYYKNAGLGYWPGNTLPGGRLVYNSTTGRKNVPSTGGFAITASEWQLVNLDVKNAVVSSNCTQGSVLRGLQSGSDAKYGYLRYIKFLFFVSGQYALIDYVYLRNSVDGVGHGAWGSEEAGSIPNTVSLNSPTDGANQIARSVDFRFTPVLYQTIQSAFLWTNETGNWARTQSNTTKVLNNTENTISYTFGSEATFLWNVEILNSTGSVFAPANRTIAIGLLTGWLFRKSLTISNSTGAGTNYPTKIQVNYNSSGGPSPWVPYYDLSSRWTTITGNPTDRHGFDPVHKTNIVEVDKTVDGAIRKYLAYDSDSQGYQVRLYYTDDLDGSWTAYSGNPILSSGSLEYRIPSVAFDGSTFHMFVNDRDTYTIRRFTSTDGINFGFQENVLTDTGYSYKAPFIWFNPNDNRWYLYWLKVSGSTYMIVARNSTDITAFAAASDVIVHSETGSVHFSFQTVMYRDNAYWMLGESQPSSWVVRAFKSTTSPTSGFVECSDSPILTNDEACPRQLLGPDGTKAYLFSDRSASWYQDTRLINSTFPSPPSQQQELNAQGHCRTDFGDIRFTDSSGSLLSYWIQEKIDGNYSIFWVKIPNDLSNANATIYMYYGKSNAVTTSNGDDTFIFFDHFLGTTLNNTKWISSGTVTVASSICTVQSVSNILGNTQVGTGYAFEALSKTDGSTGSLLIAARNLTFSAYNHIYLGYTVTQNASGKFTQTTVAGMANTQYHRYTIVRVSDSTTRFYYDDTLKSTHTTNIDVGIEGAGFHTWTGGISSYVDWVLIRRFVSPEPYLVSWGNEEPAHGYYLNITIEGQGSVNLNATEPYNYGDVVQLTALPDGGWSFDHWSVDLTGSANPATITMNSNKTVIAHFTTGKPALNLVPTTNTFRKYGEQFPVTVGVSGAYNVEDFEFEIRFNTTLLNYTSVVWGALGSGTISADEASGLITGHVGPSAPISGPHWLLNITFKASCYHIWKNEATILGWRNNQTGTIFIQWANLSYPTGPDKRYERGVLNEIDVGPDVVYTWWPIKGDVDLNGTVDIYDLLAVADYYEVAPPDPLWSSASKYELTNAGREAIDLYDLVVIASNYGYSY